jgi:two-component system, NtrC family, sensor kinase
LNTSRDSTPIENSTNLLLLLCLFIVAYILLLLFFYNRINIFAEAEAEKRITDILYQHRAVRSFVSKIQKPEIYRLKKNKQLYEEYFSPQILSSSFVSRSIMDLVNLQREEAKQPTVYFKVASDNPLNPRNRASPRESEILKQMNAREITKVHEIITKAGEKFLYIALPVDPNTQRCLRCHGDPADAPQEMLEHYDKTSGFGEKTGQIRALISIRAPLVAHMNHAWQVFINFAIVTFIVLFLIYTILYYFIVKDKKRSDLLISANKSLRLTMNELSESKNSIQLLLESINSIFISLDLQLIITRWNRSAVNILGMTEESVLNKNIGNVNLSWDWNKVKSGIERCSKEKRNIILDNISFTRVAGNVGILVITIHPIFDSKRNVTGYLILGEDFTQLKNTQVQLSQSQKLESIGQLAAGLAHEINTPMQYISDNLRFMLESYKEVTELYTNYNKHFELSNFKQPTDELSQKIETQRKEIDIDFLNQEILDALTQSLEGSERVNTIIRSMKNFSQQGTSNMSLTNINKGLEDTVAIYHNTWKYVTKVELDLDPELPLVNCFAGELNQVFLNLLINATQAIEGQKNKQADNQGLVIITSRLNNNVIEIKFKDNGGGIPDDISSKIFDPFFTTKDVGKGTGQGLALAYKTIVEKHHGTIRFESVKGIGTTFIIELSISMQK